MNKEELKNQILHVFEKQYQMTKGVIPMRYWRHTFCPTLNHKEQNLFEEAIDELISEGKIVYHSDAPECLCLTEKGYETLFL